jgi:hypothetical protein
MPIAASRSCWSASRLGQPARCACTQRPSCLPLEVGRIADPLSGRQPPGETVAVPAPARRRPLAADGLTFSDPDRQV